MERALIRPSDGDNDKKMTVTRDFKAALLAIKDGRMIPEAYFLDVT